MNKMKVLITGAEGFVGKKAVELFSKNYEVIATGRNLQEGIVKMDITNKKEVLEIVEKYKPEILFNCAAFIDVEKSEHEKLTAWEINVDAVILLAQVCKDKNIKFVAISSDYIFSGDNSPYFERDIPHPKSFYGFTKKIMEEAVLKINPDAIIIRPSILYGFNPPEMKDKLVSPIIESLKQKKEIAINDFRSKYPVLIDELVKNSIILIEKNEKGIFNFASKEKIDRYEMANIVAEIFELDKNLIKKGEPIKDFKNKPLNVELINSNAPYLVFSSFEEGIKKIKLDINRIKTEYSKIKPEVRPDGREITSLANNLSFNQKARIFKIKIPVGVKEKEHLHTDSEEIFLFLTPGEIIINSELYYFDKGDLVIIPKNQRHKIIANNPMEIVGIKEDIEDKIITENENN